MISIKVRKEASALCVSSEQQRAFEADLPALFCGLCLRAAWEHGNWRPFRCHWPSRDQARGSFRWASEVCLVWRWSPQYHLFCFLIPTAGWDIAWVSPRPLRHQNVTVNWQLQFTQMKTLRLSCLLWWLCVNRWHVWSSIYYVWVGWLIIMSQLHFELSTGVDSRKSPSR